MQKGCFSYRIPEKLWRDREKFLPLLRFLADQENRAQDIALFVGSTHSVRTIECVERSLPRLGDALREIREHGFSAGINLLSVMGHHFENASDIPEGLVPLTGSDGAVCPGTACPSAPANREYHRRLLLLMASAGPDFLWLDDDLRFAGHGDLRLVCFCDHCMKEFNRRFGTAVSRDELLELFDRGDAAERLLWRRRRLQFSGEQLCGFFKFAEAVVHGADPAIALGGMDAGMRAGDSASMDEITSALAGNSKLPLRWRPGGGAYTDQTPAEFLIKAHMLGCESALIPDRVDNIQAEIENFNYQRLNKSETATACEASLYAASGLTGAAWNCLDGDDPLSAYKPLIRALSRIQPFIDLQTRWSRIRPVGVWHGWQPGLSAVCGVDDDTPWEEALNSWNNPHFSPLFAAGVPPAYRLEEAFITILTPGTARNLSAGDLEKVFSRGVYCLAEALPILEERGFAHLTGFAIDGRTRFDAVEQLLPHPINQDAAGFQRDCRQSFPWGHEYAWHLKSRDGRGVSLARLIDHHGREIAPCSLGIYENQLGGRVAAAGYYPLRDLLFQRKLASVKRLFRWLSGDAVPAEVLSYHRVAVWVRKTDDGTVVQLCNASLDPARDVTVRADSGNLAASFTGWDLKTHDLAGTPDGPGRAVFTLPEIAPWHTAVLVCR